LSKQGNVIFILAAFATIGVTYALVPSRPMLAGPGIDK